MISVILAFVTGVLCTQWLQQLPPPWLSGLILPLLLVGWRFSRFRLLVALTCGVLWASFIANLDSADPLPLGLEGKPLLVEGVVVSLPDQNAQRVRFNFEVKRLIEGGRWVSTPSRIRLSWYRTEQLPNAGELWQLRVKLKRPHGFMNPGGSDYEGWLFRNGLIATGYVRKDALNRKLAGAGWESLFLQWREGIRRQIIGYLGKTPASGLLLALTVGDRSALEPAQWQVFTRTGTNHLVAISGLHIGIVAGLLFLLVSRLWCYSSYLTLRLPAQHAGAITALLAALFYAGLAGFAVPTLRALLMLVVMLGSMLLRRPPAFSLNLAYALLLVTLFDPYVVLSAGFWLSFGAVAAILYVLAGRVHPLSRLGSWIKIQGVVVLALAPLLLIWGMQVSLVAPVVNLVAVPVFSLVLVPLALVSVLLIVIIPAIGQPLLGVTAELLGWSYSAFAWVAELPLTTLSLPGVPLYAWGFVIFSVILLISPPGVPGKWLAALLLFLPAVWLHPVPQQGQLHFTLLDVGQGLSAVVQTQNHRLIYDTGPKFSSQFDAASAVIIPFLREKGVRHIDRVILSNGDSDHSGGFESLAQAIRIDSVWSGEAERFGTVEVQPCVAGMAWDWDGVQFEVLHPDGSGRWQGNDASCVLLIKSSTHQLLLTGDVGSAVERVLLERFGKELQSLDLVTVPHHGSLSSSDERFVKQLTPKYALVSSGYRNRYGFPKPQVMARWRAVAQDVSNTADVGAVIFSSVTGRLGKYRCSSHRYWHRLPGGKEDSCD